MSRKGLSSSFQYPVGNNADGIAIFDMDGDGKKDVVVTSPAENTVTILFSK
jgi:hypothetical protein